MLAEILYTTVLSFVIVFPIVALFFAVIPVIFFTKSKTILRQHYQNKLILFFSMGAMTLIFAKLVGAKDQVSPLVGQALNSFAISVPVIFYAVCIYMAAKRLNEMGFSRFYSLIGGLPILGPSALIWLALTIRQKKN